MPEEVENKVSKKSKNKNIAKKIKWASKKNLKMALKMTPPMADRFITEPWLISVDKIIIFPTWTTNDEKNKAEIKMVFTK